MKTNPNILTALGSFDSDSERCDFRAAGLVRFHQLRVKRVQRKQPTLMELQRYEGNRVGWQQIEKKKHFSKCTMWSARGRCDSAAGISRFTGTFSVLRVARRKDNRSAVDGRAGWPLAAMYREVTQVSNGVTSTQRCYAGTTCIAASSIYCIVAAHWCTVRMSWIIIQFTQVVKK